jgi:hypothetical protein
MTLAFEAPAKSLWSCSETWGRFARIPFLAASRLPVTQLKRLDLERLR